MSKQQAPIKNYKLYNQSEISRSLGISQCYISRVMRGKAKNKRVLELILKVIEPNRAA